MMNAGVRSKNVAPNMASNAAHTRYDLSILSVSYHFDYSRFQLKLYTYTTKVMLFGLPSTASPIRGTNNASTVQNA